MATVLQTISLADRLVAAPMSRPGSLRGSGLPIRLSVRGASLPRDNTVTRAAALLAGRLRDHGHGDLVPLSVGLDKRIPAGAGLGGGSSDAAATLIACTRHWCRDLSPSPELLAELAAEVGSDVPFFLVGGTAMATGRGERVDALAPLSRQWLVVVAPQQQVSTAEAYQAFDAASAGGEGSGPMGGPGGPNAVPLPPYRPRIDPAWMGNDLADVVASVSPAVEEARRALEAAGAGVAQTTGSGAASFGTFSDRRSARLAAKKLRDDGCWARACVTVSQAEHARASGLAGLFEGRRGSSI